MFAPLPFEHVSLSATAWRLLVLATIATELLPDRPSQRVSQL